MKFIPKMLAAILLPLSFLPFDTRAQSVPFNAYSVSTLGGNCTQQGSVLVQTANGASNCIGAGVAGQVLRSNGPGADVSWLTTSGTGTVTSVGATVPSFMSVSGSPVTASGTLGFSFTSGAANQFLATPNGSSGVPSFRSLVGADLPAPGASSLGGVFSSSAPANQFATGISLGGVISYAQPSFSNLSGTISTSQFASQTANAFLGAPNGASGVPSFRTLVGADLNYTASGTGAIAQSAQQQFAHVTYIDGYNASHNGTSDDATPLTNAMTALGSQGGKVILSCAYNYAILSNVTIPANVIVEHCNGKQGNPGVDWTTGPIASQPHINLSSTATITMSSNSGLNAIIINSAITPPVQTAASYAGTAVKLASGGANDVRINALIVGFATCVDGTNGGDRQNWNVECDGNPTAGIGAMIVGPSFDTSIFNIRTYPWGTVAYPTSPTNTRTGIGVVTLSGTSDDDRFNILDFGHATGVQLNNNGNAHFYHVWTDNNVTSGIDISNCDRCTFDDVYAYTTATSVRLLGNGIQNIGYLLCDNQAAAGSNCVSSSSGTPRVHIGHLDARNQGQYAINVGGTGTKIVVDAVALNGINGGAGPYIVGVAGWTSNQVKITQILDTDLPSGNSLFGGNAQGLPQVASAATIALSAGYDHFLVTGTTTITNITGTWNDRRIILSFNGAVTVTNNANINLIGSTNFTAGAGSALGLWYDQANSIWRAEWQH